MRAPSAVAVLLGVLALVAFTVSGVAIWWAVKSGGAAGAFMSIAFVIVATMAAAAFGVLHGKLLRPLATLTGELTMHAQTRIDRAPTIAPGHWLDGLPAAVAKLVCTLHAARGEIDKAVNAATLRAQEQKSRLEAILLDLSEGVIVCNLDHRILLYNQAAARILNMRDALGLNRSLFGLLTREPVVYTLELLLADADAAKGDAEPGREQTPETATRGFVCSAVDLSALLQARLSLVHESSGLVSGYVLTFADVGAELESLAQRDALLREVAVEWRRPLASLRAAAEMLAEHPRLDPSERSAFENIVSKEVEALNHRFGELTRSYDRLAAGPWPLADIHSLDLFRAVRKHLAEFDGIQVTPVGVPAWVHADSHSLLLALEHLIRAIARHTGKSAFDIGVVPRDKYAYVEMTWDGEPVPSAVIDTWLGEPLRGTIGNRTLREIVERHASELWSQSLPEGRTCLRLPLRSAERPRARERSERVPPWSEFYDFDLFKGSSEALKDTPLRKMTFVVFDTEATGLRPNEGDELLSIGAVRVVNGRILTGETFERLVNPGRDIPASTTRIHGITSDMVRDKPPAPVVLAQFKAFVGDAALVAYNAAFDMTFLEKGSEKAGVKFDNPVLDSLLLSVYLQEDVSDFSLTAAADRMGVEVVGRHTALGDALTTAAIFVKLIDLLEARAIETFGQAARISKWMIEQRRQEAQLR
jgi:DNA polymerase-3 subunit epsilon